MKKLLAKSNSGRKTEKSIVKYGLHRRERIRHQTAPSVLKLISNLKKHQTASNDANYYEATAKEVRYATA